MEIGSLDWWVDHYIEKMINDIMEKYPDINRIDLLYYIIGEIKIKLRKRK